MKNPYERLPETAESDQTVSSAHSLEGHVKAKAKLGEQAAEYSTWLGRLQSNYHWSYLVFVAISQISGGMCYGARKASIFYIFKELMHLQPSQIQKYDTAVGFFIIIRVFIGLFYDLRLVQNRKLIVAVTFLVLFGTNFMLAWSNDPDTYFRMLMIEQLMSAVWCCVKDTWQIEQSRKDVLHGQGDLQSINVIFGPLGSCIGSVIVAYSCDIQQPKIMFFVCMAHYFIGACFVAFVLTDDMDKDILQNGKDQELLKYEQRQRSLHPEKYAGPNCVVEPPSLCQQACFKLSSVFTALCHPLQLKFIAFQLLQGVSMPSFAAFDYVYSLNVLKIPLDVVNTQNFFVNWVNFTIPWFYQRYFVHYDLSAMFMVSQAIYVMGDSLAIVMVKQWNLMLGIPNVVLYILSGSIASELDKGFHNFPSYIIFNCLVPQGIENSLMAVTYFIIDLNVIYLRQAVGIFINDNFVHVTNEDMSNYIWLKIICVSCFTFSFLYLWFGMVPSRLEVQEFSKQYSLERGNPQEPQEEREEDLEEDDQPQQLQRQLQYQPRGTISKQQQWDLINDQEDEQEFLLK